jgi:hypothetical protein
MGAYVEPPMEPSPPIHDLVWGSVTTAAGVFRDAKLWPGGGRGWDWRETGTQHVPGIQATDVAELLQRGAKVVILSQGQQERLHVHADTLAAVQAAGASAEVLPTAQAVARYNELADQGVAVGALIHSTC